MAPSTSQSMRTERSSNGFATKMPHSRTIPVHLETANSEESSIFEGLNTPKDISHTVSSRDVPQSVRFQSPRETSSTTPRQVGRYRLKSFNEDYRATEAEDGDTASMSVVRSKSEASSEQSYLRNMRPMTDLDSAFGVDSREFDEEQMAHATNYTQHGSRPRHHDRSQTRESHSHNGQSSYLIDQDGSSRISNGSVNSYFKSKGTYNMVSHVDYVDQHEKDYKPGNEERITAMLDDYEKQMEATLQSLTLDDDRRDDIVGDRDYLAEMYDIVPRRVQSEDAHQTLTSGQSKQLQSVLQQARTEVEILKDNNEQFMSEIEQQEEEYSSEKKLFEERTRQKISELKIIYQEEIENIIREKDAAIVEASLLATRYGESGRKQIAHLKGQLEKVKAQANSIIRQKIEEAIKTMNEKKEKEVTARLGALRKSYETEFEKIRNERDIDVQQAVNKAISTTTQRLDAEHQQKLVESLETCRKEAELENQNAIFASNQSLAQAERQVDELQRERDAFIKTLEAIKENISRNYPAQMKEFHDKSRDVVGPLKLLQTHQSDKKLEDLFKEVIESFGFLVENSSKKSVSYNVVKMDDVKKEFKEQEGIISQYREEVENVTSQKDDETKNIESFERSLHHPVVAHNQSEDLYQREFNPQLDGIKNMHSADDLIQGMSKRRERLARAMVVGQMELENSMSSDRMQMLKPKDRFVPQGLHSHEANGEDGEISGHRGESHSDLPRSYTHVRRSNAVPPQVDKYGSSVSIEPRPRDTEVSYESPAKKKSYAILRSFKASKRRGFVDSTDDSPRNPRSQGNGQTRTQRMRGYFNTARIDDFEAGQNDNSTMGSLTDESLESLQTNTGTEVRQELREKSSISNLSIDNTRSSSSLERSKGKNPLGMFAQAKKEVHNPRNALSTADTISTRAEKEETLLPLQNGRRLPRSFRKKAGEGFDHLSAANVLNGKKPAAHYGAKEMLQNGARTNRREQENSVPGSVSLQNSTSRSSEYSGLNGYSNEDDLSYLSDSKSLRSVNGNTDSIDDDDMSRLRQHTSLTDASDDESADPFLMTETESSDRTSIQGKMYSASSSRDSSRFERPPYSKQRRGMMSPASGSEATTAVVSHQYKPNLTSFYKRDGPTTKTSKMATNFASRIRARRGGRRAGG